jgi:hypothetical protein
MRHRAADWFWRFMNWSGRTRVFHLHRNATIDIASGAATYRPTWEKVRGAMTIGILFVGFGWWPVSMWSPYLGGALCNLGTTLFGLGVYWRFQNSS